MNLNTLLDLRSKYSLIKNNYFQSCLKIFSVLFKKLNILQWQWTNGNIRARVAKK